MKRASLIILIALQTQLFAQVRVACVGDSITFGAGIANREQNCYPARLQVMLGSGYQVKNFGRSGARLSKDVPLAYWDTQEFKDAIEFNPNIVIIMLGTNDCWPPRWEQCKNTFVPTFREFVSQFRNLSTPPTIYVCTPTPLFDNPTSLSSNQMQFAIVPLVNQAARELDCSVIDLNRAFMGKSALFPDRLHPNASGAALMAEEIAEVIAPYTTDKKDWKIIFATSQEDGEGKAEAAIDGNPETYWHSRWSSNPTKVPHEIVVDMGNEHTTSGFYYLPRQDGGVNGRIRSYEFYGSIDGKSWELLAKGEFKNESSRQRVDFLKSTTLRFFKLIALTECNGGPWTTIGEIDLRRNAT